MYSKEDLIKEADIAFEKNDINLINSWKKKVLRFLVESLESGEGRGDLKYFHLYFNGQKKSIDGPELNMLGSIQNLFLIVDNESDEAIISEAKELIKKLQ